MPEWMTQIDPSLFFSINRGLQNSFFDAVMPFITSRSYFLILPFLVMLFIKERKNTLIVFAIAFSSLLLADGTGNVLKHLIERVRPCNAFDNVHLLVGCGKSFAMPSNHAGNAFAFAVPFLLRSRSRLKYVFIFIAALVAFSRVYVGVHYLSDVVAGAVMGALLSLSVVYLYRWAERRFKDRPYTTVLTVFLLAITLFRLYYIVYGPMDLSPDEAHYWEWSRRLDLSYYSKGPLIAYLIALGTAIFGDNTFGVRIFAVLFSLLSSMTLYKIGRDIYNEKTGVCAAIIFQIVPVYSAFGVVFTIDSPFIFFWILSLYLFRKAVNMRHITEVQGSGFKVQSYWNNISELPNSRPDGAATPRQLALKRNSELIYWLLLGISVGLGLLTKYTMFFFLACALLFLIASKEHRRLLKTYYPYLSALASLIVFSPVLLWNARHGWLTFLHTAGQARVAEGMHISLNDLAEFVGSQFGIITPVLFVLLVIALWKAKNKFLLCFSAPVLLFFVLKSLQGKVQANWAMMGYITGLIAFSEVFISNCSSNRQYLKNIIIGGAVLSLIITGIAHYPSSLIPLKIDTTARLRGWRDLGNEVSAIYEKMSERGDVFIFSDSYQAASELAFYVRGHPVTYCVNLGRRMNQYDLWPGFNNLNHYDSIFVRIDDVELPDRIQQAFDKCEKQLVKVYDKGRLLRAYSIFSCKDFKGMEKERITRY